MRLISSTDVAIALAAKSGTLRIVERASRFGGTFAAIEDAIGVIEVHNTRTEAESRIRAVAQ